MELSTVHATNQSCLPLEPKVPADFYITSTPSHRAFWWFASSLSLLESTMRTCTTRPCVQSSLHHITRSRLATLPVKVRLFARPCPFSGSKGKTFPKAAKGGQEEPVEVIIPRATIDVTFFNGGRFACKARELEGDIVPLCPRFTQ